MIRMIRISTEDLEQQATDVYQFVNSLFHDTTTPDLNVYQFHLQLAVVFLDIIRTELSSRWNIEEMCKARQEFNQRTSGPPFNMPYATNEECQCP